MFMEGVMEQTNSMILIEKAKRIMKESEINAFDAIIKAEEELKKEYEANKKGGALCY